MASEVVAATQVVSPTGRVGETRIVANLEGCGLVRVWRKRVEQIAHPDGQRDRLCRLPTSPEIPGGIRTHDVAWILIEIARLVVVHDPDTPWTFGPVGRQRVLP